MVSHLTLIKFNAKAIIWAYGIGTAKKKCYSMWIINKSKIFMDIALPLVHGNESVN